MQNTIYMTVVLYGLYNDIRNMKEYFEVFGKIIVGTIGKVISKI